MRSNTIELIGGALIGTACLGLTWFVLWIYLPWMWRMHVENAKWLHGNGDRSFLVRATLKIASWFRLLRG